MPECRFLFEAEKHETRLDDTRAELVASPSDDGQDAEDTAEEKAGAAPAAAAAAAAAALAVHAEKRRKREALRLTLSKRVGHLDGPAVTPSCPIDSSRIEGRADSELRPCGAMADESSTHQKPAAMSVHAAADTGTSGSDDSSTDRSAEDRRSDSS